MKKIFLIGLVLISLFLISCTQGTNLPLTPGEPGTITVESAIAGQAIYLGEDDYAGAYADDTSVEISGDVAFLSETFTFGTVGETVVWSIGYYAHEDDTEWTSFDLEGDFVGTSDWIAGDVDGETLVSDVFSVGNNYLVLYACSLVGDGWSCHEGKWMAHVIEVLDVVDSTTDPDLEIGCSTSDDCPYDYICIDSDGDGLSECKYLPDAPEDIISLVYEEELSSGGGAGGGGTSADGIIDITIGLLNPITGPIAVYSYGFEDAANVAINELNSLYPAYNFILEIADSGCDGSTAATATGDLVDAGVVGIAGAACSGATLGAMGVAKIAGIPMISYASADSSITTSDDSGYLFRVVTSDADQGKALSAVANDEGFSNTALLYMDNDYGSNLASSFYDNFGEDKICITVDYSDSITDFSLYIDEIEYLSCDSVVAISYAADGTAIIKEMDVQALELPFLGADGIAESWFASGFTDVSLLDGVMATKLASDFTSTEKTAFEAAYAAAEGYSSGIYIAETYDAINIIAKAAMADTNGNLRDDIITVGTDYVGASGIITFDTSGDISRNYLICKYSESGSLDCGKRWSSLDGFTGAWDSFGSG